MKFDNELYHKAIFIFGSKKQSLIAMEECSELCQSISKCLRYYDAWNNTKDENDIYKNSLIEEIADVLIMIVQLKDIYDINEQDIQKWINDKEIRLKNKLDIEYDIIDEMQNDEEGGFF